MFLILTFVNLQINGDTDNYVTFAELLQKIVNIATGLKTIGMKKDDVVALCSENCSEYIAVTVAASCVGATVTTFNINYTKGIHNIVI